LIGSPLYSLSTCSVTPHPNHHLFAGPVGPGWLTELAGVVNTRFTAVDAAKSVILGANQQYY
jgi:hypothetical protein